MPTIDELAAATSVSDGDELMISQSDIARKATRAQLLSGVQPALAVAQGTLLGRVSSGIGNPEAIAIGANLTVANATLSAPPAFSIAGQSIGSTPQAGDLVAVGQGGQNAAISFATFAAGLAGVAGIGASNFVATPTGGIGTRLLADLFSDAISVESFGAVGDGETDDTAAFTAAFASGRPLRLDGNVYAISGTLTIAADVAMIGVAGQTALRRTNPGSGGTWITLNAASFTCLGVIFDAGSLAAVDAPAFEVAGACQAVNFRDCQFMHAMGADNGHGLLVSAAGTTAVQVDGCNFTGNSADGLNAAIAGTIVVQNSTAEGNGGTGIFIQGGIGCAVRQNHCSGNQIGIAVGNWQSAAPVAGSGPDIAVSGNFCTGNASWGVAVAGAAGAVTGNDATGNGSANIGGGILCRMLNARVLGNRVDRGAVGIDARTCASTLIAQNQVSNTGTAIAAGATQNLVVSSNFLLQNGWGIVVNAFEPSLSFTPAGPLTLERNWIGFTLAQGGGIQILDGVQGATVSHNDLNGWGSASVAQALWIHTDAAVVRGNRWNNTGQFNVQAAMIGGAPSLVIPDVADSVLVTSAPPAVSSVVTSHQVAVLGQITFIRVTQGGAGYTQATASISGSGAGAAAEVVCANGQVVGLVMTNPGSGYGAIGAQAAVTVSGDGSGAAAIAWVGLPVLAGRALRVSCSAPLRLTIAGSSPAQQSWTQYDLSVPAFGAVELLGANGGWYAVQSPPVDYVAPTGTGSVVLQSVGGGDLFLRPSAGGNLRIASAAEPAGCTSTVGRGAPSGVVAAPPGSDFRNLNGGPGNTFWIKCTGTDDNGWVAVA